MKNASPERGGAERSEAEGVSSLCRHSAHLPQVKHKKTDCLSQPVFCIYSKIFTQPVLL